MQFDNIHWQQEDKNFEQTISSIINEFPHVHVNLWQKSLLQPAQDFLQRGGKSFRSAMVQLGWQFTEQGESTEIPHELPRIIEYIHAGSLIVDDIEDESSYRRGKPCLHCTYGLPLALNTGNLFYFIPFALLQNLHFSSAIKASLLQRIVDAQLRCHMGQALDLGVQLADLEPEAVFELVRAVSTLKTGTLMQLAVQLGAIAGGGNHTLVTALGEFGCSLGVALQMLDDFSILRLGNRKTRRLDDLLTGRVTWIWVWLAEKVNRDVFFHLRQRACEVIKNTSAAEQLANEIAELAGHESHDYVHSYLQSAFEKLQSTLGPSPLFFQLQSEIDRLEQSYG